VAPVSLEKIFHHFTILGGNALGFHPFRHGGGKILGGKMDFGPDKECVEGKFWVETVSSGPIRPEKIPTKSIFGPDKERLYASRSRIIFV
jgi:hypothetical protein